MFLVRQLCNMYVGYEGVHRNFASKPGIWKRDYNCLETTFLLRDNDNATMYIKASMTSDNATNFSLWEPWQSVLRQRGSDNNYVLATTQPATTILSDLQHISRFFVPLALTHFCNCPAHLLKVKILGCVLGGGRRVVRECVCAPPPHPLFSYPSCWVSSLSYPAD